MSDGSIRGTPAWVTEEIKADFVKKFRILFCRQSDFTAFGRAHNLTGEQLEELKARYVNNCGGLIAEDPPEYFHYCPNCGVRMLEEKKERNGADL